MVDVNFDFDKINQKKLEGLLDLLGEQINDFRIPFMLMASAYYRGRKRIFTLKSSGLYQDLSPEYKKRKKRRLGFAYPILRGVNRNIEGSITSNSHKYSVFHLDKSELVIGTKVPYGKYHQSDAPRTRIPLRKFLFLSGGPQDKSKDAGIGDIGTFQAIIETHIKQLIEGAI